MLGKIVLGVLVFMFGMVQTGSAGVKDDMQKYFNNTASKVKAVSDPALKREILENSLRNMSTALDKVSGSGLISQEDQAGISLLTNTIKERQDELAGANGYEIVANAQLNDYTEYIVQDMNQAGEYITISVVAALLIVIILLIL